MARYHVAAKAHPKAPLVALGTLTITDTGRLSLEPVDRDARTQAQDVLSEVQGLPGIDVPAAPLPDDPPGATRMQLIRAGEPGFEDALVGYLQRLYGWQLERI